ncbi:hypothetical protein F4808DRAFT_417423 [Astrocystis sublimbata]|nr:hypothetical protein F4808DRAFT_417423 [Astrocystis sublimbata]
MADTPASTQRTRRQSLDVQFNAALLDFAAAYMKNHLERLALECGQRLELQLLPKLHAVLREIDQERISFEEQKRDAVTRLREHLSLLSLDAAVIDHAVSQLHDIVPPNLPFAPTASSLALFAANYNSLNDPTEPNSSEDVRHTSDEDSGSQAPVSPRSTPDIVGQPARESSTKAEECILITKSTTTFESDVHTTTSALGHTSASPQKRQKGDEQNESDVSSKRQRTDNEQVSGEMHPRRLRLRRVAFPNLMTGECMFRHAKMEGFFIIRCDYCKPGIFKDAPLRYNRALKHFQKHGDAIPENMELTNEYIFENFALHVEGDDMASGYWIREHVGEMPHTFVPSGSAGRPGSSVSTSQSDLAEFNVRDYQELEDTLDPSYSKLRESLRARESDRETEQEEPRRARRNVPRPDYAEMVANKDPWNSPEFEIETTVKAVNTTQSSKFSKRRLTKHGIDSFKSKDDKKPFGYMSDPWPRRSAPR